MNKPLPDPIEILLAYKDYMSGYRDGFVGAMQLPILEDIDTLMNDLEELHDKGILPVHTKKQLRSVIDSYSEIFEYYKESPEKLDCCSIL